MRLLVTGAGGFLGNATVDAVHAAGHEVVALVRPTTDTAGLGWRERGITPIVGDLLEPGDWIRAVMVDAVVHLAAAMSGSLSEQLAATVLATERLLDALNLDALTRFVHVSSLSVYDFTAPSDGRSARRVHAAWSRDRRRATPTRSRSSNRSASSERRSNPPSSSWFYWALCTAQGRSGTTARRCASRPALRSWRRPAPGCASPTSRTAPTPSSPRSLRRVPRGSHLQRGRRRPADAHRVLPGVPEGRSHARPRHRNAVVGVACRRPGDPGGQPAPVRRAGPPAGDCRLPSPDRPVAAAHLSKRCRTRGPRLEAVRRPLRTGVAAMIAGRRP